MRPFTPIFPLLIAVILATSLLSGCQTLGERKQSTTLEDTLRIYAGVIRWGTLSKAYSFRDPESMDTLDEIPTGLKNIRVTSYEVAQGPIMTDEKTAMQTVLIEYIHKDMQVIRNLQDKQMWRYNEETESWALVSKVPQFK
ncbi:MAG: hypothetical protein L3J28_11485 [Candidatus Polarisedimenticolaceae bacterium]|nr:hypothetical protein [Candidatus Polarisedimenticolaceae bacterium]